MVKANPPAIRGLLRSCRGAAGRLVCNPRDWRGGMGLSSIEPNDGGNELDRCQEVSGGLVVSGGDAPELLESAKEILDQVAGPVCCFVVVPQGFPLLPGRDYSGFSCQ